MTNSYTYTAHIILAIMKRWMQYFTSQNPLRKLAKSSILTYRYTMGISVFLIKLPRQSLSRPAVPTGSTGNMRLSTQKEQMSSVLSDQLGDLAWSLEGQHSPLPTPLYMLCVLLNSKTSLSLHFLKGKMRRLDYGHF